MAKKQTTEIVENNSNKKINNSKIKSNVNIYMRDFNDITDFAEKENIEWEYIMVYHYTNQKGEIKKQPFGLDQNIKNTENIREQLDFYFNKYPEANDENTTIYQRFKTENTKWSMFDIDKDIKYEDLKKEVEDKCDIEKLHLTEGNNKGYHLWFKLSENIGEADKIKQNGLINDLGDYISRNIWERPDKKIYLPTQKATKEEKKEMKKNMIVEGSKKIKIKVVKKKDKKEEVKNDTSSSSDEILDIDIDEELKGDCAEYIEHLNNIDLKYIKNYDDCYKIIYSCYRENHSLKNHVKNLVKPYSTNQPKSYDEWFEDLYENGRKYELLGDKTIKSYSYKSNTLQFFIICNKYNKQFVEASNISKLSELFIEANKEYIVVHKENEYRIIYVYNQKFKNWEIDYTDKLAKGWGLKGLIDSFIEPYYESWTANLQTKVNELKNSDNETELKEAKEELKECKKALKSAQGNSITNAILEKVVRDLFNNYNDNHIKFDCNIQLLPFKNGKCIDLFTFETRDITKDDYIVNKLKYDWISPSKEDMEEFNEHFNKITEMPDDKNGVKKDILYMLTCGMFAHRIEYFFILNGKGRNGKGLLMDWYNLALEGLLYNASPSALCRDIDGGKPDPSVAGIDNKRAIVFGEGKSNVKASQATIKMLVGDSIVNCRSCNSNKTEQINVGTYMALCNEKPTIDGKLDSEGIGNKIRDIYFHNTFTPDKSKLNLPNHYPQNPKLKNPDYKNKMKYCLLNKLIQFAKKFKEENGEDIIYASWDFSKQVVMDSKAYIQDCDIILTTIKENYDITESQDDKVSSEEIYDNYIMNNKDIVNNPKIFPQYKGLSLRNFRKYLENDCEELKYNFRKNPTLVDGKTKRGVFLCLKKKKEVEEEEEENKCMLDIDSDED